MKCRTVFLITIGVIFCCECTYSQTSLTGSSKEWLTSKSCQPPCWVSNLQMGITDVKSGIALLRVNPLVSDVKVVSSQNTRIAGSSGQVSWLWAGQNYTTKEGMIPLSQMNVIEYFDGLSNPIDKLSLYFPEGFILSDVVAKFGEPRFIFVITLKEEHINAIQFIYDDKGFLLQLILDNSKLDDNLNGEVKLNSVTAFYPASLAGLYQMGYPKDRIIKWSGWLSFNDYYRLTKAVSSQP